MGCCHDVVVTYDCARTLTELEEGDKELGAAETRNGLLRGFLCDDSRGASDEDD